MKWGGIIDSANEWPGPGQSSQAQSIYLPSIPMRKSGSNDHADDSARDIGHASATRRQDVRVGCRLKQSQPETSICPKLAQTLLKRQRFERFTLGGSSL